ncbi:MAG: response regulator [Hydrogenophaga sp.]|uniref:ATP-binding protein n=1 Tax=Hydrogenophaga sp. TaxID=1904254 RepID=UPI001D3229BF|nr:ATP-binding protein [Hydrogenophaga sp.]MBX3608744.1 response regulator [Hydrogenophaga sp.]
MPTTELFLDDDEADTAPPRWREVVLHRSVVLPVLLAALLLLGLAAGLAGLRQQNLDAERRTLGALVAALADQADSALAASQTAMQATTEELASGSWHPSDPVAQPLLRARAAALPWVRQLLIAGPDGSVLQSADDDAEPPPLAQADYFRAALGAPPGSAGLGTPERWPGEPQPWVPLSMPWYLGDGRQAGVIVLAADPSLLVGGFTRTSPAADARLQLVRSDGRLWLAEPAVSDTVVWPEGWRPPADERAWTLDLDSTHAGGRDRHWLVVGRALQRAPMTMVLTRDRDAVLQDWRGQAALAAAVGGIALLITAALSLRHAREQRWRELSQHHLQRQQARAARAFNAAREGLWEWLPERERHYLSPRMRELMGFLPGDEARANAPLGWDDRIDADERARLAEALRAHLAQGNADFSVTLRVTPPGQTPRHVRVRGRALARTDGAAPALAGTAYDVTDEVAMADQARRLDEQLQRARRLEALGTLAGGVAHDFNNVLAAIQGFGERAHEQTAPDHPTRVHLDRILEAARRGKTLVERLTASGQGSDGQPRQVRPREVLREAWALATEGLPATVHASLDMAIDDVTLDGDPVAWFEACLNLLRNAVQALHGQGRLQASLHLETVTEPRVLWHGQLRPGHWLRLSVLDDGPGIAPEHLPHLLDPFFTTRAGTGGTGLGMTVVHNTVRDADGALDLQTAPGEGTRFDLYVPWRPVAGQVPPNAAAAPVVPTAGGQGEVILVVDDEPALVELLEETLADLGYEPRGFTQSSDALAAFTTEPALFDAVISDQLMPGLNGLSLIARCKALAPDIVSVIVTAYGGTDFERRAADSGVDAVIKKPLSLAELSDTLERLFLQRRRCK